MNEFMRFLVSIIFTAVLAFIAGLWLDWWSIALAAFIAAFMVFQSAGRAFAAGFLGVFIFWGALSWWINSENKGILAKKIAAILPLSGNPVLLVLVTALVGALVAGVAATAGNFLRAAVK
jgi:hypothetical protein